SPTGNFSDCATARTALRSSVESRLKPSTCSPWAACSVAYLERSGNSSRQGSHQVAQNVRITTCPSRSEVAIFWPSSVTRLAGGAGAPRRRSFASARRSLRAARSAAAPRAFNTARRAPCACSSKCIAGPEAGRPAREELVAVEVTVDRNLCEGIDVQLREHHRCQARAQVRDIARRALDVRQRSLIGRLVQQIHLDLGHPARVRLIAQPD